MKSESDIEVEELKELGVFLDERMTVLPRERKELLEFFGAMRGELLAMKPTSRAGRALVAGYLALIDAELRVERLKRILWAVSFVLVLVSLFVLALCLPHPDHSYFEAIGR